MPAQVKAVQDGQELLRLEGIGVRLGGREILRDVSFTVWAGIVLSYRTNWPLGFYVGVIAAGFFFVGQGWGAARRRGSAPRPLPALSSVH